MTAKLRRIHALLRAGNVPCALTAMPGQGTVLLAGTPTRAPWEVLVRDVNGELRIHHAGEAVRLPAAATDAMIADVVKIRVVQAWADQGDPEATVALAALRDRARSGPFAAAAAAPSSAEASSGRPSAPPMSFVDPLRLAAEMVGAANRLAFGFMTGRLPVAADFVLPTPWATYRGGYVWR